MPRDDPHLAKLIRKLNARTPLDEDDQNAILALPYEPRAHARGAVIIREDRPIPLHCMLITSGFAYRHKTTARGARQIVSVHVPGDLLDLQQVFLKQSDHSVHALTELHVADIDSAALRALILSRSGVAAAMWTDAMVEGSISREWILNVGRRDARARVAHLLCELAMRLKVVDLTPPTECELPMTQEEIADAVGMTNVHVNRTLKSLERDGLIARDHRRITFADWPAIRKVADFDPLYLHLEHVAEPL